MRWWNENLGDGTVGELVLGLSLLFVIALAVSFFLAKYAHKDNQQYPTMAEIASADRNAVKKWVQGLPVASTPSQLKLMREISHKYLEFEGLAVPLEKRPNAKSMTCECGKCHPLVHVFGKCGSCMDKILEL